MRSTLTPDRLHSAFYDSHPPALVRITRLLSLATQRFMSDAAETPARVTESFGRRVIVETEKRRAPVRRVVRQATGPASAAR